MIFLHFALSVEGSENLFFAGPSGFTLRAFASRLPAIFLHFVNTFQSGCIFGNREVGTDAEAVDRRLLGDQLFKSVFIEIAAGEDPGVFETAFIQNGSHLLCQLNQIAAVQPHSVN